MSQLRSREWLTGVLAAAILFGMPGGPAVGGGIAGYLDDRGPKHGALVGLAVGLVAAAVVLIGYTVVTQVFIRPGLSRPSLLVGVTPVVAVAIAVYGAVFASAGGAVGSYLSPS